MERMLVVVFDNEKKAFEGRSALRQLEAEGSITYLRGGSGRQACGRHRQRQAARRRGRSARSPGRPWAV